MQPRGPSSIQLALGVLTVGLAGQLGTACTGSSASSGSASAGQTSSAGAISAEGGNTGAGDSGGSAPVAGRAGAVGAAGSTTSAAGSGMTAGAGSSSVGGGAGSAAMNGGAGAAGSAGAAPAAAREPVIPAISGTCPAFVSGTATIAGLSDISLQVGAKKAGSGSLLFYWHGTGSSASEVNALVPAAVRQEILAQGGIIVSFQGSLGTGGDCSGTKIFSKDDFKVADLIAACAVRDHGIDARRIYTTGCSAGGLQAGCMGALRSSYIAATAPNSGGETSKLAIQDPSRVPAVMTMHGGDADKVVVSFATTSAAYDNQMKAAGSFVVNCNHGGDHCGAPAALQTAAWSFMKDHPFGVEPQPYAAALPAAFPSYCATF